MSISPHPSGATLAWLLVAVLLSLVVALCAALLKTKDGAKPTAAITSAGVAFAGAMALCVTTFAAVDLL